MATITVNGVELPSPIRGLEEVITTAVNSGRNANGEVIGEVVGRNQYKIDNLEWRMISREEWSKILRVFDNFFVTAKIFDMLTGGWITLKMYPGDRTAQPYFVDADGNPTVYYSAKVNIIDCGVVDGVTRS